MSSQFSMRLVRTTTFSSAHRYYDASFGETDNRQVFGSLFRDKGFGHNFVLEGHFEGMVDPLTGMIENLVDVDRWLGEVAQLFDHRHLNEVTLFSGRAPTPERIAEISASEILARMNRDGARSRLVQVRIYEGEDLWADCFL